MRFIHIADVHLGVEPDAGFPWSRERAEQVWESFRQIIELVRKEKPELLLIAGDLFHRQPLLRELREVNELFSQIPHTTVVLMAGNHDYLKKDSFYRDFPWEKHVVMLMGERPERVDLPSCRTAVYGCSYHRQEITEPLYDSLRPDGPMRHHILLAHGGDARHIPWSKERLGQAGFDYIACGHIHRPEVLIPDRMAYAGALEPTDLTQMGEHGYIRGEITEKGTRIRFVPFARWSYQELPLVTAAELTQYGLEQRLTKNLEQRDRVAGDRIVYRLKLSGEREPSLEWNLGRLMRLGRIVEVTDETRPAYDLEQMKEMYRGSLIAALIERLEQGGDKVSRRALEYGLEALLAARRE